MATQECPAHGARCPYPVAHSSVPASPLTRRLIADIDPGGVADRAPAAVVETVNRCYRIQDAHRGDESDWDAFTAGRHAGYAQTLSLLLGVPTREVGKLLRERAL